MDTGSLPILTIIIAPNSLLYQPPYQNALYLSLIEIFYRLTVTTLLKLNFKGWNPSKDKVSISGASSTENNSPPPKRPRNWKEKVSSGLPQEDSFTLLYPKMEMYSAGDRQNIVDMASLGTTPSFLG